MKRVRYVQPRTGAGFDTLPSVATQPKSLVLGLRIPYYASNCNIKKRINKHDFGLSLFIRPENFRDYSKAKVIFLPGFHHRLRLTLQIHFRMYELHLPHKSFHLKRY